MSDRNLHAAVPRWDDSTVVVEPPDDGPGCVGRGAERDASWTVTVYLAYRLRRPIGAGRGYRQRGRPLGRRRALHRGRRGAQGPLRRRSRWSGRRWSHTPEGRWRLYVSVATPGTKHWRVDLLEADTPEGLATAAPRTVLPGDDAVGVKDPVSCARRRRWHLWASVHPLDDAGTTPTG